MWEALQEQDLYRLISSESIKREVKDKKIWKGDFVGGVFGEISL